ncbi:hypothetical protein [Modestobacter roseus]|uniref:hypothetical protein n=1 Tax=Modestobacter roseus TaxID=1181884 RepID=UPI0034E00D00
MPSSEVPVRALVVYESLFGNAETIARAIARGLATRLPAEAVPAAGAPETVGRDVALLVVGGPNHAMAMPRPSTREDAVNRGAQVSSPDTGLREWLGRVQFEAGGTHVAAFDTRMDHPRFLTRLDHAARTEEKLLLAHGGASIAPAEHFLVLDTTGPLAPGEEQRAEEWGARLGARALAAVTAG